MSHGESNLEVWMKETGWNRVPIEGELVYEISVTPRYKDKTLRVRRQNDKTYSSDDGIPLRIEEDNYQSIFIAKCFRPLFNGSGICTKCMSRCFTDKTESCPFFKEKGD